jgi:hypothetical protein
MFSKMIVAILILSQLVYSLRSKDFCFLNHNSSQKACLRQCGQNLCSTNDQSCEDFNKWSSLMNKYDKSKSGTGIYHQFIKQIKDCKPEGFISLKSDVCSLSEKCNEKRKVFASLIFKGTSKNNPIECACNNKKLINDCGNGYCALYKNICTAVFQNDLDMYNLKEIELCKKKTK